MARIAIQCQYGAVEIEGDYAIKALTKHAIKAIGALPTDELEDEAPKGFGFQIVGAGAELESSIHEDPDEEEE